MHDSLTISVVLCTYNGSTHLPAQLASIARQTRLPDEVIVRDDRSRDDTLRIVEEWGAGVPFHVRAGVNPETLGSSRNFTRAIAEASGQIIVLCDQDDVWMPQKLARFTEFFELHPALEAVFTDAWVVDQELNRRSLLSENVGFRGAAIRQDLTDGGIVATLAARATVTGATMALRASLRDAVLPLPERMPGNLIHDGWIAIVAALRGTLGFIDEPLILYRQHATQQVGLSAVRAAGRPRWLSGESRARMLADNAADAGLLVQILRARFPHLIARLGPFEERARHQAARRDLPAARARRILPVLRELLGGRYRRYGQGLKTALGDLRG